MDQGSAEFWIAILEISLPTPPTHKPTLAPERYDTSGKRVDFPHRSVAT